METHRWSTLVHGLDAEHMSLICFHHFRFVCCQGHILIESKQVSLSLSLSLCACGKRPLTMQTSLCLWPQRTIRLLWSRYMRLFSSSFHFRQNSTFSRSVKLHHAPTMHLIQELICFPKQSHCDTTWFPGESKKVCCVICVTEAGAVIQPQTVNSVWYIESVRRCGSSSTFCLSTRSLYSIILPTAGINANKFVTTWWVSD